MRHYGAENFKTLLLLKVTAESIQAEFYSQWLSRNCIWDFEMFSFLLPWDTNGSNILKTLLLQIAAKLFHTSRIHVNGLTNHF